MDVLMSFMLTCIVFLIGHNVGIYGDSVLFVSKMGQALIDNGIFAWGSIPTKFDPGHPPFLATYLVVVWQTFGKNLLVTHLAMLPFVFCFCYELSRISHSLIKNVVWSYLGVLLVLADPTVFATLIYVNPDVLVMAFSAVTIRCILQNQQWGKAFGLALLGISTMRGMLLCAGLFLLDCTLRLKERDVRTWIQQIIIPYTLGAIPAVIFVTWRICAIGWIVDNPLHPWGEATSYDGLFGFVHNLARNIAVEGQRITDFGRIVPICISIVLFWKQRNNTTFSTLQALAIMIIPSLPVIMTSLVICNPMGHVYFIWVYIGLVLLLVTLLDNIRLKQIIYSLTLCCLLLGNLIVYPYRFAQGWHCSLAGMPYWPIRQQMIDYLNQESITQEQTYWFWPEGICADDVDMRGDRKERAASINKAQYVVISNVGNPSDEEIDLMETAYNEVHRIEKNRVFIALYKKK